jgi:hypothetical protein
MSFYIEKSINIVCASCEDSLEVKGDYDERRGEVKVLPCKYCLAKEKDKGIEQGHEAGYDEAKRESEKEKP